MAGNYTRTPEIRLAASLRQKNAGRHPSAKGIKWSLESRSRLSERLKKEGRIPPSRLGIPNSPEQRLKISATHKARGNRPIPMYGDSNPSKRPEVRKKLSGENCHFWKGGITPLVNQIRNCFKMREWVRAVFKRDNYRCQKKGCSQRGGDLNADHYPSTFSQIFKKYGFKTLEDALGCAELWDINNGRTLCITHHRETFSYGKR